MSPELIESKNSNAFIWFRILFNCRLYYPIFTILFLDYGLTLEQFSMLNVVWALSIVFFEVPSGALADIVGRRRLVVFAAFLMVCEMAVLLFAPRMSPLVFWLFLINRVLSGLAEASASGADEALTYDSLTGEDKQTKWNTLLARSMKYQSIVMVVTMLTGAFLYDWKLLTQIFPFWEKIFSHDVSLRIPIAINFAMAIFCFFTSLRFVEEGFEHFSFSTCRNSVLDSFKQIGNVASYIYKSSTIFPLILFGLVLDSSLRMFVTLISNYYRELGLAESLFGVIGASMALVGILSSNLGSKMAARLSAKVNFTLLSIGTLATFLGILVLKTKLALILVFTFMLIMFLLGYFMSYYINRDAPSKIRATLLSFKGLAFNLAYGWVGFLYARVASTHSNSFSETLPFFSKYFIAMLGLALFIQVTHKVLLKNKKA